MKRRGQFLIVFTYFQAFDLSGPNSLSSLGGGLESELQTLLPQSHHRSNQLKLQESTPKFLTVEVISSKAKASVTIDGTTVCRFDQSLQVFWVKKFSRMCRIDI